MSEKDFSLIDKCTFVSLTEFPLSDKCVYHCQKAPQIDVFFHDDFRDYEKQLLGKSYAFYLKENKDQLVAAFTIANSALILDFLQSSRKNRINKGIPRIKQRRQYPALLIAQLAVFDDFAQYKVGDELLDFIKEYAYRLNHSTACRYLMVDALNEEKVIRYYERNHFSLLYSSEEEERDKMKRKLDENGNLATRLMIFDLLLS